MPAKCPLCPQQPTQGSCRDGPQADVNCEIARLWLLVARSTLTKPFLFQFCASCRPLHCWPNEIQNALCRAGLSPRSPSAECKPASLVWSLADTKPRAKHLEGLERSRDCVVLLLRRAAGKKRGLEGGPHPPHVASITAEVTAPIVAAEAQPALDMARNDRASEGRALQDIHRSERFRCCPHRDCGIA